MVAYRGMKKATPAEREHLARIKALPCCVCTDEQTTPTTVHHILQGSKRMGHFYVLPLCKFHHQGWSPIEVTMMDGPAAFEKEHGSQRMLWELLMSILGITHVKWPESKIVPRDAA